MGKGQVVLKSPGVGGRPDAIPEKLVSDALNKITTSTISQVRRRRSRAASPRKLAYSKAGAGKCQQHPYDCHHRRVVCNQAGSSRLG